jgi:hypothetical protein
VTLQIHIHTTFLCLAAESDRNRAEQLLSEHRRDFDQQFEENQSRLQEIGTSISEIEAAIPGLNREVCGADSAPCDPICGGPTTKCSHCGGSSCSGSVSRAAQAQEFAEEAAAKVRAKQHEAEEILKRVREAMPSVEATQRATDEALRAAQEEVEKANRTRVALTRQINETRSFLESERNTPADIADLVEQIMNITIPFNEDQIRKLSENVCSKKLKANTITCFIQIRDRVLEVKDADKILDETRGNKTTALALQSLAERASQRASRIHNTTQVIKEQLEQAEKAQGETQAMLTDITSKIDDAK